MKYDRDYLKKYIQQNLFSLADQQFKSPPVIWFLDNYINRLFSRQTKKFIITTANRRIVKIKHTARVTANVRRRNHFSLVPVLRPSRLLV